MASRTPRLACTRRGSPASPQGRKVMRMQLLWWRVNQPSRGHASCVWAWHTQRPRAMPIWRPGLLRTPIMAANSCPSRHLMPLGVSRRGAHPPRASLGLARRLLAGSRDSSRAGSDVEAPSRAAIKAIQASVMDEGLVDGEPQIDWEARIRRRRSRKRA
ncbi:hypothetical protein CERSUDRAFT_96642 [Gelatoporia subvermispora B]|uniref:Uncharacterized protein n=1 Tax=Ceriporiopsis subvermispora (strain B) TaxID=914234 RepID=M2PHJ1_CERS8|nr:hypothetical protein CERSUDRAFT_96642 [Gelatoporia subvermispora B]